MAAFRAIFRDKRAVTPVLANLLLTVVAVAAMSIATSATYVITVNLRETLSERAIIEDLWFDPSGDTINVYLRNVGEVSTWISAVYVNHTQESFESPFSMDINEHGWLNISCNWSSGSLYYMDIVTSRGTHVGGYHKTP